MLWFSTNRQYCSTMSWHVARANNNFCITYYQYMSFSPTHQTRNIILPMAYCIVQGANRANPVEKSRSNTHVHSSHDPPSAAPPLSPLIDLDRPKCRLQRLTSKAPALPTRPGKSGTLPESSARHCPSPPSSAAPDPSVSAPVSAATGGVLAMSVEWWPLGKVPVGCWGSAAGFANAWKGRATCGDKIKGEWSEREVDEMDGDDRSCVFVYCVVWYGIVLSYVLPCIGCIILLIAYSWKPEIIVSQM